MKIFLQEGGTITEIYYQTCYSTSWVHEQPIHALFKNSINKNGMNQPSLMICRFTLFDLKQAAPERTPTIDGKKFIQFATTNLLNL